MSIDNLLENRILLEKQLFWLNHSFDEVQKLFLEAYMTLGIMRAAILTVYIV